MSELAIETQGLSRVYKTYEKQQGLLGSIKGFWERQYKEVVALQPTTLQIGRGQIVGLVGANGAGKTTLLKMLAGLVHPSAGAAKVLGYTPWERKNDYLRRMSVLLGQKNQLWWDISPLDSFALLAEIYDLDHQKAKARVNQLAELLETKHVLNIQLRRLSLGERMKMEIIGALLHSPDVLFLDEPTIGLDIVAQTTIRRFISEYVKNQGPTVILTSHYMDDITKLADRLLLISKGSLVYDGTVPGFMQKSKSLQQVSFALSEPLSEDFKIEGYELKSGEQQFVLKVADKDLPLLLSRVTTLKGIHNLKIEEADFEEIIRDFLEKESRIFSTSDRH